MSATSMEVPVAPQTASHLPPASMNNGKKRLRIRDSPDPDVRPQTRRKRSSAFDIRSLSEAQVATLSEAASILQLPTSALLELAPKPKRKANCLPKRQRKLSLEMDSKRSYPRDSPTVPTPRSWPSVPIDGTSCNVPSFGLGLVPKQIAECFANFIPSGPEPGSSIGYTAEKKSYPPNTEYANSPHFDMSSASAISTSQPVNRVQTYPSTQLSGTFDSDQVNGKFACDDFIDDEWESLLRKPYALQDTQPTGSLATMSYHSDLITEKALYQPVYKEMAYNNYTNLPSSFEQDESSDLIDLSAENGLESHDLESADQGCVERFGPTPRRPFQSNFDREQTAQTRKNTACIRCRMQRIRCHPDPADPAGTCLTCQKVLKPKLSRLPCLRYKLADVRLFREGSFAIGHEWSHRWSSNKMENITTWASPKTRTIYVTQDYGETAIAFKVRKFIPMKGDMLYRQWADGDIIKSVPIPNYAIVDMAEALQAHKDHIVDDGPMYFKTALSFNDRLLWDTYSMAIEYSNSASVREILPPSNLYWLISVPQYQTEEERTLLQMVLQLWVTIRMCVKSQRISGPDTLGMSTDLMDSSSPMHGKIPVPPVLAAQAQFIVTQKLQAPLRHKILDLLQKLTLSQKPDNWFCIYLCTFMLLHNCSLLTAHDMGYARKHGLKRQHARLDMVKELHNGANVLLAHFHYCCKGFRPFTLDWNPTETVSMAKLDTERIRFVRQTAVYVNINESSFKKLLDEGTYHSEHYFVAQLYEAHWQPRSNV